MMGAGVFVTEVTVQFCTFVGGSEACSLTVVAAELLSGVADGCDCTG